MKYVVWVLRRLFLATYIPVAGCSIYVAGDASDITTFLLLAFLNLSVLFLLMVFWKLTGDKKSVSVNQPSRQLRLNNSHKQLEIDKREGEPRIVVLIKLILPAGEEQDNIVGDLLEEFSLLDSKFKAHVWLYKQVLKSVMPLIYKNLKSRLASYFKERVR